MSRKRILVTGSNGFIGTNLLECLKNDYEIEEFNLLHGDIASAKLNYDSIDHVVHLAGQTYVPLSWENPYSFYKTNVLGTVNILDFCRSQNASLTYISAYVYGVPQSLPISESHPLQAANPYMHSKIEAESVCQFYSKNYGVRMTILRPFNIYGAGQNEQFIIPKIAKQVLSESKDVEVFSLSPKRDYLYIDDLTRAIKLAIENESDFDIFNIGSGVSFSVQEVIDFTLKAANKLKPIKSNEVDRKNEIPDVVSDISHIKKVLGWEPQVDILSGLKLTIDAIR